MKPGDVGICVECNEPFTISFFGQASCDRCLSRDERSQSKAIEDEELLRYLALSPEDQLSEGRSARSRGTKGGKKVEDVPTCSRCGAVSMLSPCRGCDPDARWQMRAGGTAKATVDENGDPVGEERSKIKTERTIAEFREAGRQRLARIEAERAKTFP